MPSRKIATHENTAGHAPIVALGARTRNGGIIPPRDFMRSAYTGPEGKYNAANEFVRAFGLSGNLATAFQATVNGGNVEQRRLIRSPVWRYDRATLRKNGALVPPGLRDIVDQGELISSHQPVRFR